MIAAAVDTAQTSGGQEPLRVRGKPLHFWLAQFVAPIPVRPLQPERVDFDHLLLFSDRQFLAGAPPWLEELCRFLAGQRPDEPSLWGAQGSPLVAVSRAFYEHHRDRFRPGVFQQLQTLPALRQLPVQTAWPMIEPESEPLRLDQAIVNFQLRELRRHDVSVEDGGQFYLEGGIPIGAGTRIASGAVIRGQSEIGLKVSIGPHCVIENSLIGNNCILLTGTVICDSRLEEDVQIGPYTHLRAGAVVKRGAKMGNFVEMKKSVLGEGSKSMHLAYIGDATVGKNVNIGAGTITCNYDGEKKNSTVIEDNVFIGSGTELVAPVTVHKNSYVGAGSTITDDVPENALAIARQRQRNILGWVLRKKKKKSLSP